MTSCERPLIWSGFGSSPQAESLLGAKAASLARLQSLGLQIPPFYVVTTAAWHVASLTDGLQQRIAQRLAEARTAQGHELALAAAEICGWIQTMPLPKELTAALREHPWTHEGRALAVRSSVAGEDSTGHSFAGLHESVLGVRGCAPLLQAIRAVWASAYNQRALAYRRQMGLDADKIPIAVIVQPLIATRSSGVLFTANPATGNVQEMVINSLFGLGEGLVSAGLEADTYVIEKDSLTITSQLAHKTTQYTIAFHQNERPQPSPVPVQLIESSSLASNEITQLSKMGLQIEQAFGRPQDIEFVIDEAGQAHVLQSRPITTIDEYGPAAGNRLIWDNSNIIESYYGVTTPMTFSFIRRAYTIVYYCFAEVMGISPKVVRANAHTFENMLGLFRGRVYYNLLNWYRLLRLFPGFHFNKQFLESMMGLSEPVQLDEEQASPGRLRRYVVELPALLRLLTRMGWHFLRIRSQVRQFNETVNNCLLEWRAIDFAARPPHEIMSLYRKMEDKLLWDWKAPIINDFYVMVYCGLLRKLCKNWCGDAHGSLANDLLCGDLNLASAAPVRRLLDLAHMAQGDPELKERLLNEPPQQLADQIRSNPRFGKFAALFHEYLELYGARRMNELKLEENSFRDQPEQLFELVRHYLQAEARILSDVELAQNRSCQVREQAEMGALGALKQQRWSLFKSLYFRRVLKNCREGVRNREQMRLARMRVYDLLRDMLHAIADRFAAESVIKHPDDIFYLTLDEVWDYIKGTAVTTELKGLVALRRSEYAQFAEDGDAAPADRFETYGLAYHRNRFRGRVQPDGAAEDKGDMQGVPCSSGVAIAKVRILDAPSPQALQVGEILVTERTDPGWVPLFPTVSGILIERGSILSHSAIVAREMGIPTIVGIPGLVQRLRTGDRVTMDGATGKVKILNDR